MIRKATTGLPGLDEMLGSLQVGDNVVWQIERIADYRKMVGPYVRQALAEGKTVCYIRFARHDPLVQDERVRIYPLDAYHGFEHFCREVYRIISMEGRSAYYVFDCLSDLLSAWATDQMIGRFFKVTCPYLYELDTIAYFAIQRGRHNFKTIARIRETTQLLLDLYHCDSRYYLHPLKVSGRYSPTMFLPHLERQDRWVPITSSVETSQLFQHICKLAPDTTRRSLDYWDLLFLEVEEMLRRETPPAGQPSMIDRLCRLLLGTEGRILELFKRYFTLEDFVGIKDRLLGTGFIGGKAAGMLLARKILTTESKTDWNRHLEPHDSFYIGSDVWYDYLVQNGLWRLWMEQKKPDAYFSAAAALRAGLLAGEFSEEISEQFRRLIDYFGQSPIIVRSSSVLEDSFGNAFAGKYESIFLANQGSPEERCRQFADAVRRIYASVMSEEALMYRQARGLDQQDEQMALLVQRVSGSYQGRFFLPFCAGVGVSYNTFVSRKNMGPRAGMLRLVFGLGTRAVNRSEEDYPRIIALDDPLLQPYADQKSAKRFSQHQVDVLDTAANDLATVGLRDIVREVPGLPLDKIGVRDRDAMERMRQQGNTQDEWILTFEPLLSREDFLPLMQEALKTLEKAYQYPVDTEFTANFLADGSLQINLLQCRPLQTKGLGKRAEIPRTLDPAHTFFRYQGYFAGGNVFQPVKRVIAIDPEAYLALNLSQKYSVARLVGKLNSTIPSQEELPTLLIGPGRWGTSTPSLGVAVAFSEINKIAALVEISFPSGNLMPELSFGSHFFQDLVEAGIFYTAIFSETPGVTYRPEWLAQRPNRLPELLPDYADYARVIRVCDTAEWNLHLVSDVVTQQVLCYASAPVSVAG